MREASVVSSTPSLPDSSMVQRPVKNTPGSITTLVAATSPSTCAPAFISMTPRARMFPTTRPRTSASRTSTSERMIPCSPISRRSQFRMSPSNSPSMRNVPVAIRVPRNVVPTPITVPGIRPSVGAAFLFLNFIMVAALVRYPVEARARLGPGRVRKLENTPSFEEALQVFLPVVLELDLAALASRLNGHMGAEALLKSRFPLAEPVRLDVLRPRMLASQLPPHERFSAAHREPLDLNVPSRGELIATRLEAQKGAGVTGRQCFT